MCHCMKLVSSYVIVTYLRQGFFLWPVTKPTDTRWRMQAEIKQHAVHLLEQKTSQLSLSAKICKILGLHVSTDVCLPVTKVTDCSFDKGHQQTE